MTEPRNTSASRYRRLWWVVVVGLALAAPFVLSSEYQQSLLVQTVILAIVAVSLNLVMGDMGQFSFGHAAFWGAGAYASAKLAIETDMPVWLGYCLATAVGALLGLGLGFVALRRTRGLELSIVTLGFGVVLSLVALRWYGFTGGPSGLGNLPRPELFGYIFDEHGYYLLVLAILAAAMYFVHRFAQSRFGRAVRSVNENEELATSVGVAPMPYFVLTFALSAGLAGLAGALEVHHFQFVAPSYLGLQYMIIFLVVLILGGVGSNGGPIVGATVYVWATELLRDVSEELRFVIFGLGLTLAVILMPRGIYPTVRDFIAARTAGRPSPPDVAAATPEAYGDRTPS